MTIKITHIRPPAWTVGLLVLTFVIAHHGKAQAQSLSASALASAARANRSHQDRSQAQNAAKRVKGEQEEANPAAAGTDPSAQSIQSAKPGKGSSGGQEHIESVSQNYIPKADANASFINTVAPIFETAGGNVGIGTTTPGAKLQIDTASGYGIGGNAIADGLIMRHTNTVNGLQIMHGGATAFFAVNPDSLGSGALGIGTTGGAAFPIHFYTGAGISNGTASTAGLRMTINGSGNVGIGTTVPDTRLTVVGSATTIPTTYNNGDVLTLITPNDNFNAFSIAKGGVVNPQGITIGVNHASLYSEIQSAHMGLATDALILNRQGGNVGIGTANPVVGLDVAGRIHAAGACGGALPNLQGAYLSWNQLCGTGETDLISHQGLGAGGFAFMNTPDGSSLSTLMFITGGGNVGIGTTGPTAPLHVYGGGGNDTFATFGVAASGAAGLNVGHGGASFGAGNSFINAHSQTGTSGTLRLMTDANTRIFIGSNGYVGIGTTAPQYALDVAGTISGSNVIAKYQDVAEWVPASRAIFAGSVVVLDSEQSNHVQPSSRAYDTRVAGVVSASPGLILGEGGAGKVMVATTGRVRVKVDATSAPIRVGDLLVTSDKEGIAMRSQPLDLGGTAIHRPGTLIGKALEPLEKGVGEILVLLSLQ